MPEMSSTVVTDAHPQEQALVQLRRLSKRYPEGEHERTVLHALDASFRRGECVLVLGRSGSGKSTLLNLIAGIDAPTAGEVFVDGVALARLSETERTRFRCRRIGFVFQFFHLIPTLTVEENLHLPLALNHMLDEPGRAFARSLLQQVGLADRAESFPDRLSGGEQQRVAIARALVHRPSLVLADEPTGNLDDETGKRILELLSEITEAGGSTLIMASHSVEALKFAERAFRLEDGGLIALAPTERAPA